MADGPVVEVRVLGPLEVVTADGIAVPAGPRQRAVLAVLALARGQIVSVDRLAECVWGAELPRNHANAVQILVSRLRDGLGRDAAAIVTRPPGYLLDIPFGALDAARFEESCAAAGRSLEAGDAGGALAAAEAALALWRGTPLAEFQYEDFASNEVARLEELRMVALESRADALLALGRGGALVPDLEALVRAHPHRERLWGQLMLALYRSGRQADALAAYREARTSLEQMLGIDPSPALRRLETAILQQDVGLETPPASIVAPLRAARVPVPATELVGRDDEARAIASRLASPDVRLLTLTGPGGVGKTRLALEVASRMQETLRDGAAFVPLAPIDDPALAAPAIAAAIGGVSEQASPESALLDAIAERELLLVLDNCEHLLAVAPLVAALLARAPRLTVLVTSRFALRIGGEHEQPVEPLAIPPEGGGPAVELFASRARAADASFTLDGPAAVAAASICRRLDGLPLAIELAAARVGLLGPEAILARLRRGEDALAAGPRDRDVRQRSLRAAMDWSWDLLDPAERHAFARLAVFPAGFDADAAVAVAAPGQDHGLELLASLLSRSLVRRERSAGGNVRLGLLSTIRAYAWDRLLEAGEDGDARSLHSGWYLALAEADGHAGDEAARAARLEREAPNLRAALAWAVEVGEIDVARRMATALAPFFAGRDGSSMVALLSGVRKL